MNGRLGVLLVEDADDDALIVEDLLEEEQASGRRHRHSR